MAEFSSKEFERDHRLIGLFVRHPTAGNLLMVLLLLSGILALTKLNVQFFPTFSTPAITVSVVWSGASAEDVEANIIEALEPQLRYLDDLDKISAVAREGVGRITLEFVPAADMQQAQSAVEQAVDSVNTLPEDAEKPTIARVERYERVANISVSGPYSERAIADYAKEIRDGLLDAGIDKVAFTGLRSREIEVRVNDRDLYRLDLSLQKIAASIRDDSQDLPSGTLEGAMEQQLRSLAERKSPARIGEVEVKADKAGNKVLLNDIARIEERFDEDDLRGLKDGQPAIEMEVQRSLSADTLKTLSVMRKYLDEVRPTLPANLRVELYDVRGDHVVKRLNILVINGIQGLVLVLVTLFLFLNARIAFWVAAGIPVALMATLFVMLMSGQTLNMVSMFGLIMMLGIIVDDAIVVGEHTATRQSMGDSRLVAAERGAGRMLMPVIAATLTTMSSFLPMMMLTGRLGDIMGTLPLVVMAVLVASTIECFFILPGHLRHGFGKPKPPGRFRVSFDRAFERFREGPFKWFVSLAYDWRYSTLAASLIFLLLVIGLLAGGHVHVRQFPSPPPEQLRLSVEFAVGTPQETQIAALDRLERSLYEAELEAAGRKGAFIVSSFTTMGKASRDNGDNLAEVEVQLTSSEERSQAGYFSRMWQRLVGEPEQAATNLTASDYMDVWRKKRPQIAGIENVVLSARRMGPGGADAHIELFGADIADLKRASEALKPMLAELPGVSAVEDDLPYGKPELILQLTPRGRALGFTALSVGTQVRNAFQGAIARRFAEGDEEITVRVKREQQAKGLAALENIYLLSPAGDTVPLNEVVSITEKAGFSLIKHEDGRRIVSVTADVDSDQLELPELVRILDSRIMPKITGQYGVHYKLAGAAEDRAENFRDLKYGTYAALALIYIILAWVFGNYFKPLAVMAIIPFGIVGAVFGHVAMNTHMTMVSMIGLLGLSGILVNDSIILVSTAKERLDLGQSMREAAIGAAQDRLRAVTLTSLTTIVGLAPLMFETSRQAQFLIPMAITMVFGLATATLLVLVLVPSLLGVGSDLGRIFGRLRDLYFPPRTAPGE